MDEQKQILKLAAEIANMDLGELVEGYRKRLLIFDGQIEAFRNLEREYRERLSEMDEAINNLKAVCKVCGRLNILCLPDTDKDKGPPDDEEKEITQKLTDWH